MALHELNDLGTELYASQESEKALALECKRLRRQHDEQRTVVKCMRKSLDNLREHTRQLSKKYNGIERERDDLAQRNDQLHAKYNSLKRELQHTSERESHLLMEKSNVQQQLSDLKKDVVRTTHVEEDITDNYVIAEMREIFAQLQNFVVSSYRNCHLDFSRVGGKARELLLPIARDITQSQATHRTFMIIAMISELILFHSRADTFFGTRGRPPVTEAARFIDSFQHQHSGANWKAWLKNTEQVLNVHHSSAVQEAREALVGLAVHDVSEILHRATTITLSLDMKQELARLIRKTLAFYRELELQQATLRIVFRHAISASGKILPFQPAGCEDLSYADDEKLLGGRAIQLAVFPGIVKFTDAAGHKLDKPLVIVKAKAVPST